MKNKHIVKEIKTYKELINMHSFIISAGLSALHQASLLPLSACFGLFSADSLPGKMSQCIHRGKDWVIRGGNEHQEIVKFHALV